MQVVLHVNDQQGNVRILRRAIQLVHNVRDLARTKVICFLDFAVCIALVVFGVNVQNDGVLGDFVGIGAIQGDGFLVVADTVNDAVVDDAEAVVNILDGADNVVSQTALRGDGGVA